MLLIGTSIIHHSTEGVFLLCNILDLLIYSYQFNIAITDDSNITVSVPEEGSLPASVFYQKFGSTNISQIGDGTVTGAITQNANVAGGDRYDSSKSYAAGDYFIYNDQLCKALTAIASGAALTPGNNYQVTSLEKEIAGLNGKKLDTYLSPANGINLYDDGRYVCLSEKSQVLNINDTVVANAIGSWCFVISFTQREKGIQFITSLFSSSATERTIYKRCKASGIWSKWTAINVTP